jgi:hypothetical protein
VKNWRLATEGILDGIDQMKGRCAQILPTKAVDDELRLVAEAMLTVKGITPTKMRSGSKRPRFKM